MEDVMKKVLVSLLVLAVAVSGAFAGVTFSGNFKTGYVFQLNDGDWTNSVFGQDNTDSNQTKLNLSVADDNGYWSMALKGPVFLDGAALSVDVDNPRLATDLTLNLDKIIGGEDAEWTAQLQVLGNNRVVGERAYTNKSGLSFDRVRSEQAGLWVNAKAGYGNLVTFQIGGSPVLNGRNYADNLAGKEGRGDLVVSAMTKAIDGLAISVDWALIGDTAAYGDGVFGAAADINVGALVGLDFDLGVGVADKLYYGENGCNVLAAQVYGGMDAFSAFGEFVLEDETIRLHFGADITAIENVKLNVYGGIGDLDDTDSFYVGGNVGYTWSGITFGVNVQYAPGYGSTGESYMQAKGGDIAQGAVKATGFSITPSIAINF